MARLLRSASFLKRSLFVPEVTLSIHLLELFFFNVCLGTLLLLHPVWSPRKFRTVSEMEVCKLSFWTQKHDYLHSTEHIATGWLNGVELACFQETKTEVLATVSCFLNLFLGFHFPGNRMGK